MELNKEYEEKVYSGVLGKIIGVYLGRPFEGWWYDRIIKELGPINYYVNDKFLSKIKAHYIIRRTQNLYKYQLISRPKIANFGV